MTLAADNAIDAGTVVLGPATKGDNIVLGAPSSAGTLGLQTADLATITAGMLEVGYRQEDATASFTGAISIAGAGGISLNPATIPTLLLVTGGSGGTVTQTEPITFSAAGGTLGVIAGGNATLNGANSVSTFAGYADNGSAIAFSDHGPLTVGALPAQQLGVAVDPTTGLAGSASMTSSGNLPSNPLAGATAIGGGTVAVTTTAGNLTLADNVTASGETVTLTAVGTIDQTAGVITAGTLTGSSIGGATLPDGNLVTSLGAFTDTGAGSTGIAFSNAQALGTTGTVSSVSGPVALTTTGTVSNLTIGAAVTATGSTITLTTTDAGSNLTLGAAVTAAGSVTLYSAGTIDQTAGVITATTLNGTSVGGASLTQGNLVTSLGAFTDIGDGSTGIAFTNAQALGTTGTVSSATGPITLTTTGTGSNLTLGAAVTAAGNSVTLTTTGAGSNLALGAAVTAAGTVTLDSTGTVDQTAGVITAATLTGPSVGGASLMGHNLVTALGAFTDTGAGSTGIGFTDAQSLVTTGSVSSAIGPITLTTVTPTITSPGRT